MPDGINYRAFSFPCPSGERVRLGCWQSRLAVANFPPLAVAADNGHSPTAQIRFERLKPIIPAAANSGRGRTAKNSAAARRHLGIPCANNAAPSRWRST